MGLVRIGEFFQMESNNFIHRYTYDSGNLIYHGWAAPGTADASVGWCIEKFTYDESNQVLTSNLPQNAAGVQTNEPVFVWSSAASYTYSA